MIGYTEDIKQGNKKALQQRVEQLGHVALLMRRNGDEAQALKIEQLVAKGNAEEMSIAFCGHFSAGKSTMINTILGQELLPSNPIPTSANVVKIRGGQPAANVYTRHSGILHFDPQTNLEELKKFAVDGDQVEWVEICYPGLFLDEKSSLLDTPGIDSTDAAHKVATESALHLADAVIYMMDYNHVQAEENFNFTKMLTDRNKPVYLVINMIDKHVEFELDFDDYKESVEEAFATWNIKPDGIFYTTLSELDHPENQYDEFREKLISLYHHRTELLIDSILHASLALIEEHIRFLRRANQAQLEIVTEQIDKGLSALEEKGFHVTDEEGLIQLLASTEKEWTHLQQNKEQAYEEMEKELSSLLQNARLTYYSTNQAAEAYVETRKPGFKIGLFFTAKKTEEERQARLEALFNDVAEKVAGNLDFHYKQLLLAFADRYNVRDEAYNRAVHANQIELTTDWLSSLVKEGAGTSEYVMNFCQDISDSIKAKYRKQGLSFIDQLHSKLAEQMIAEEGKVKERLDELRILQQAFKQQKSYLDQETNTKQELTSLLSGDI
ncbi:dynamin family protein [Brevibacillus laterosporus]|uniref:dynamin family protein n=1 Tax=Brevibacillus laterosporus TaxID=1465 RepID=UPI00039E1164|nr:dynamin family protein [Brevibacillus laterosporus]ATO48774.1 dynamin family protein [Brevibacillus laterosporus DSM 25]AYB41194.1 dynamin family protein [Brevibacillus laterosporus]MBG9796831.1 dynamin family protein [Brevibacillus laterosporus]MBG9804469.1 dynamin family protein [Brevibacillus laterosporus]MBM7108800.1 Bacterial dynamin-like protein [Brevibacillus laterosporus]